ncbi:MAG: [Lachnospiraceae bacterium]|nr:[FeFe] hydrogenase H-cluster maturation GTPase HydF [Lachnospiraceae bacterium]
MGLNETPLGERIHIGFFGRVNAGKSSLVNAVTGQQMALVSEKRGTTTDPVKKAMELLPLGPVVIIDTAGLDDSSSLGQLRMEKTKEILRQIHLAVLVVDALVGKTDTEEELIRLFQENKTPYLLVYNKSDLLEERCPAAQQESEPCLYVSAKKGEHIEELKEKIGQLVKPVQKEKQLVTDLLLPGDQVVLVVPIDKAAPKGRLILPQQQTIRELLDYGCRVVVCRDAELKETLEGLREEPALVITDSQVFEEVSRLVPESIPLTSFSILFARYKGNLEKMVKGAEILAELKTGDRVLISEGCTHHRQCGDIGSQKLPAWIRKFTGQEPEFSFTSGGEFPAELTSYKLIIHCGGCMLNEKEMQSRI